MEIKSLNKLASILSLPRAYLESLADRSSSCYHPYRIEKRKKSGKLKRRDIDNPNEELKMVQKRINDRILSLVVLRLPGYMHGARAGKSIVTNATTHLGQEAVLALDLSNCYPSIPYNAVYGVYREKVKCVPEVAKILTKLTTKRHRLPQGSPTSASLCNLVLESMCKEIHSYCEANNLIFTQYIDDLFISGDFVTVKSASRDIIDIIRRHNYIVNHEKAETMTDGAPMCITGVLVNGHRASAGRRRIRKIERDILHLQDPDEYTLVWRNGKLQKIFTRDKIRGRIASVSVINAAQGKKLAKKLNKKLAPCGKLAQKILNKT